jgi:hypothetical protein
MRARVDMPNQARPGALAAAELRWHALLQQADLTGWNRPSCSPRHNRAASTSRITSAGLAAAFGLQARQDAGVVGFDAVDADAGGLGEVAVQRFVGLVVPRRVEVQRRLLRLA